MISVITPVYNGEQFVESCIKVVIDQACASVEHIIVDGDSTDRTIDMIKRYAEQYPHIRWVSEKDDGQSDAMNKGIAMAHGEIIGILNVDDFYEPNVLNRVSEIFKTLPEPSFIVGNCNVWGDEGELLRVNKPNKLKLIDLLALSSDFPVNPSAYFYHKSLHKKLGLYAVDEDYAMDIDFIIKAIQEATVKYINELWGNYRFIKGTKTIISIENGQQMPHLKRILKKYRKNLPLFQRWQAAIGVTVLFRIKYFSSNPQNLLPVLKVKLRKILGLAAS